MLIGSMNDSNDDKLEWTLFFYLAELKMVYLMNHIQFFMLWCFKDPLKISIMFQKQRVLHFFLLFENHPFWGNSK